MINSNLKFVMCLLLVMTCGCSASKTVNPSVSSSSSSAETIVDNENDKFIEPSSVISEADGSDPESDDNTDQQIVVDGNVFINTDDKPVTPEDMVTNKDDLPIEEQIFNAYIERLNIPQKGTGTSEIAEREFLYGDYEGNIFFTLVEAFNYADGSNTWFIAENMMNSYTGRSEGIRIVPIDDPEHE